MPDPARGEVWIVDLGYAAKTRPCVILSVPLAPLDRVLVTIAPMTTSIQGTRWEVPVQAPFLNQAGVCDTQQLVTAPQVKCLKKLGTLPQDQMAAIDISVRIWLGL